MRAMFGIGVQCVPGTGWGPWDYPLVCVVMEDDDRFVSRGPKVERRCRGRAIPRVVSGEEAAMGSWDWGGSALRGRVDVIG